MSAFQPLRTLDALDIASGGRRPVSTNRRRKKL